MNIPFPRRRAGCTLSELMIGVGLSMIVMNAVLASYVFVARAYTRTIAFGSANQPTLEAQGRRTLASFAQDVQMASALSSPTASAVTLTVPSSLGGTKNVTYYFNGTASPVTVSGYAVPAMSLARIDVTAGTGLTLHSTLLTCVFTYYDLSNNPYTTYVNHLPGIKQMSVAFTSQSGTATTGTLTSIYKVASPRLARRNRALLP